MDNVSLLPIFEPLLSPRNFLIVATKRRDDMTTNPRKGEMLEDKIPRDD